MLWRIKADMVLYRRQRLRVQLILEIHCLKMVIRRITVEVFHLVFLSGQMMMQIRESISIRLRRTGI